MNQFLTTLEPLLPALIALVSAVVGAILGARLSFRNQYRLSTHQTRQRAYAELMGKKFLITQLNVSRFEALAYSDYHECLWHIAGSPPESLELEEAKRWMRKSEDFAIELARARQSLYESVGMARASYPSTPELEELSERVYHFRQPLIPAPPQTAERKHLDTWKQESVANLQLFVQQEYAEPIDALLYWMRIHMYDPVRF